MKYVEISLAYFTGRCFASRKLYLIKQIFDKKKLAEIRIEIKILTKTSSASESRL